MTDGLRIAHLRIAPQWAILRWAILRVIKVATSGIYLTTIYTSASLIYYIVVVPVPVVSSVSTSVIFPNRELM